MLDTAIETTEAADARHRIMSESERFRQMLDNAPGFMTMLSGPDHVLQYANAAYLRLVGNRELVGKPVREAVPEASGQGYVALLDKIRRTGEPYSAVGALYTVPADSKGRDQDRYLDCAYQPIKNTSSDVTHIFASGSDVTARTLADKAIKQSEARLRFLDDLACETGKPEPLTESSP